MKLKKFNSENTASLRFGSPRIIISKGGGFSLNKFCIELLGMKNGDQIKFFQDEEDESQWFIERVAQKGFKLRKASGTSGSHIFSNAALARHIKESTESSRFLIAGQPTRVKERSLFGLLIAPKS